MNDDGGGSETSREFPSWSTQLPVTSPDGPFQALFTRRHYSIRPTQHGERDGSYSTAYVLQLRLQCNRSYGDGTRNVRGQYFSRIPRRRFSLAFAWSSAPRCFAFLSRLAMSRSASTGIWFVQRRRRCTETQWRQMLAQVKDSHGVPCSCMLSLNAWKRRSLWWTRSSRVENRTSRERCG